MSDYNLKTPDRPVGLLQAVEKLMYWSQISLPAVYGEELTFAKQQAVIAEKVNEVIEQLNVNTEWTEYLLNEGVENETIAYINELVQNGTLESLINNTLLLDINQSIDQLSQNLTARINQNAADIVAANNRIDTIIAGNQPSEGNSELIDIRTSATGTVYPSAGAAVRAIENGTNFVKGSIKYPSMDVPRFGTMIVTNGYINLTRTVNSGNTPSTVNINYLPTTLLMYSGVEYIQLNMYDGDGNKVNSKTFTKISNTGDVLYAGVGPNSDWEIKYTSQELWYSEINRGETMFIGLITWGETNQPVRINPQLGDIIHYNGIDSTVYSYNRHYASVVIGGIVLVRDEETNIPNAIKILPNTYITYGLNTVNLGSTETVINLPTATSFINLIYRPDTQKVQLLEVNNIRSNDCIVAQYIGNAGMVVTFSNNSIIQGSASAQDMLGATIVQGKINVDTVNKNIELVPESTLFYMAIAGRPPYYFNGTEKQIIPFNSAITGTSILFYDYLNNKFDIFDLNIQLTKCVPILTYYNGSVKPFIEPFSITINGTPLIAQFPITIDSNITQINSAFANLTKENTPKMKIVLGGDSITHGVGGTGFAQDGETIVGSFKRNTKGYCWANLFRNYIDANYNAEVIVNGCTGTDSNFWNSNKAALIPSDTDTLILMIGTNDRNTSQSSPATKQQLWNSYYNNLTEIVNYCIANNTHVVLMSPIPAAASNEDYTGDGSIRLLKCFELNEVVQRVAAEKSLEYINLYELFYDYCYVKGIDFSTLLGDGLHPNDAGYRVMFYEIIKGCSLAASYIPVPETGPIEPIVPVNRMVKNQNIPENFVYDNSGIVSEGVPEASMTNRDSF